MVRRSQRLTRGGKHADSSPTASSKTAAPSNFEYLPFEIFDMCTALLSLPSLCNLRLASRSLSEKLSHGYFRTFFKQKLVRLTVPSLQTFVAITKPGRIGTLLETCRLDTCGYDTRVVPSAATDTEIKQLLAQAFRQLKASKPQTLKSISLCNDKLGAWLEHDSRSRRIVRHGWAVACDKAMRAFRALCHALQESNILIDSLNLLNETLACALPLNEIATALQEYPLLGQNTLPHLKTFKASLTHSLTIKVTGGQRDSGNQSEDDEYVRENRTLFHHFDLKPSPDGLVHLLSACAQLESLTLKWYSVISGNTNTYRDEFQFLGSLAGAVPASLRCCTLEGIQTTGQELLAFFLRLPHLRELTLEEMTLRSGEFRAAFDHLTRSESQLAYLHLNDIWERGYVNFPESERQPKWPFTQMAWASEMRLTGSAARKPINYRHPTGEPRRSNARYMWKPRRRFKYGPL